MRPFAELPNRWQADPMWSHIGKLREFRAMFLTHRRLPPWRLVRHDEALRPPASVTR